jgi:hypothetical protein
LIEIPADADSALLEFSPDYNLGRQSDLPSGTLGATAGSTRSRLLIRLDLAGLPPQAVVQSAILKLAVVKVPAGAADSVFALHRMLTPWREGNQHGVMPGGALAAPGETTWNERLVGEAAWGKAGGEPGVDFAASPTATERLAGSGLYEIELGAQGARDLEAWLAAPETNYGWMLISQSEDVLKTARRLASREAAENPPRLVVRYEVPPTAPRIMDLSLASSEIVLHFEAQAGTTYYWEERSELGRGAWEILQTIPPQATSGPLLATNAVPPVRQSFFRLRVGP